MAVGKISAILKNLLLFYSTTHARQINSRTKYDINLYSFRNLLEYNKTFKKFEHSFISHKIIC